MTLKTTFDFATRIRDRDFPLKIVRKEPQNATHFHCHEFTELVIVYDGKCLHAIGDDPPTELVSGNVFVIPKGVYHQYLEGSISLVNIIFETDLLPLPLLDVYAMPYFNMIFKGRAEKTEIFKLNEDELKSILAGIHKD